MKILLPIIYIITFITVILSSHILSEVQQTADHIGIIAGGILGYEGKLNANENLEQLFMDVVKSNHRED